MTLTRERKITEIVSQYGSKLFGFIRSRVDRIGDAEDVLQDVWVQLSSLINLDDVETVGAWLYRVAKNRIIDSNRKRRAVTLSEMQSEDSEHDSLEDQLFIEFETPEKVLDKAALRDAFIAALDSLPAQQREVFLRNEEDDVTFREMADETGVNIKTLLSRKQYAVKRLRSALAEFRELGI